MKKILVSSSVALAFLAAACGGKKETKEEQLLALRPCLSLEEKLAKGEDDELATNKTTIMNERIGCQDSSMFVTVLAATFHEKSLPMESGALESLGRRWCKNRFAGAQTTSSQMNQDLYRGCLIGAEEATTKFPLLQNLIGMRQENLGAKPTDQQVLAAYNDAVKLLSGRDSRSNIVDQAIAQNQEFARVSSERDQESYRLENLTNEVTASEANFHELDRRRDAIFAKQKLENSKLQNLSRDKNELESNLKPLRTKNEEAQREKTLATQARDSAEIRLQNLRNEISSLKSEITRLKNETESYKNRLQRL